MAQALMLSGTGLWTIGTLNNGATATLNITATVDVGTSGTTITNTITVVSADQTDSNTTADDPSEDIVVGNDADLVTGKTVDNGTPNEGDTISLYPNAQRIMALLRQRT